MQVIVISNLAGPGNQCGTPNTKSSIDDIIYRAFGEEGKVTFQLELIPKVEGGRKKNPISNRIEFKNGSYTIRLSVNNLYDEKRLKGSVDIIKNDKTPFMHDEMRKLSNYCFTLSAGNQLPSQTLWTHYSVGHLTYDLFDFPQDVKLSDMPKVSEASWTGTKRKFVEATISVSRSGRII